MNQRQFRLLEKFLSQPTAPFREHLVSQLVCEQLTNRQIPFFIDPTGNIIIGATGLREYRSLLNQKDDEPLRILAAHMDHPGFHGKKWLANGRLEVTWHGGSPTKHLNGARVWLASQEGALTQGT